MRNRTQYVLVAALALCAVALVYGQSRNTFIIEIPLVYLDHRDTVYIRVQATSRLTALTGAGMTVFTQAEWDDACKPGLLQGLDCASLKISDRNGRSAR